MQPISIVITNLFLLITLSTMAIAQTSLKPTEEPFFSFDKLLNLNKITPCLAKIHEEFVGCNVYFYEKGQKYLENLDLTSEWGRRISCCGLWILRDCWMEAAEKKCPAEEAEPIRNFPYLMLGSKIHTECGDYPDGSDKCSIPIWLIIISVLVILTIIIAGIFIGIRIYRMRVRRRQSREINEKPTPV